MSLENMLALLISSMLVYATPLIFTSIGGVFLKDQVLLM